MWRIPSERVRLDLDGPSIEVERINSWHIAFECSQLLETFRATDKDEVEYRSTTALFDVFVREAQPQWDIVDYLGAVPPTARGMTRLPLDLGLAIVALWIKSAAVAQQAEATEEAEAEPRPSVPGLQLVESKAPSAVDALIPAGPVNSEVKRRLRAARRAS